MTVRSVFHPLGLAGLAREDRDGVRRGRRVLRGEDVVEDREPAGPKPHEGNRIPIDVGHDEAGVLRALRDVGGAALRSEAHVLVLGKTVHSGHPVDDVDLAGQALMGVIDAVDHSGVLVWSDAERPDRDMNPVDTDVVLAESGGIRR